MNEETRWTGRTSLAIIATMGGQALGSAAQLAPAVLAIEIAADAGLQPSMIGVYTGLAYFVAAIASLGGGGLIAQHGGIRAVQFGVAMSAIGAALAASGTPSALALSAVAVGLGYGPMTPASSVVLARWAPPRRLGLIISIKQTGVPMGYFVAGLAMPALSAVVGWQNALLALAGLAAAAVVALVPAAARLDQRTAGGGGGFSSARASLALLKRHSRLRRLAVASLAFAGVQITVMSFLVVYLEDAVGLAKPLAAWPLAVAGVTAIAGRIAWGWLADLAPTARLLALLAVLMAGTLAVLLLNAAGWDYVLLTGLGLAIGFSVLAWNGVMLIDAARQAPVGQVGIATSGVLAVTYLGSTAFPQLLSLAVGTLGDYSLGFGAMIAVCLMIAVWYLPDAIRKR